MKTLRKAAAPIALAAALAAAGPAGAQENGLVPPENSAVTQYTEAFPTAKGPKNVHEDGKRRSPAEVLGERNSRRLDRHGSDGREVAELAAETASPTEPAEYGGGAPAPDLGGSGGEGGGGGQNQGTDRQSAQTGARRDVSGVDGSSGFDSILRQAFGASSDGSDTLLLLLVLGTAAWALLYGARQRRRAG